MESHFDVVLKHPLAQYAVISRKPARRLAIFVHGWHGNAKKTWGKFVDPPDEEWWNETDLLFISYDSIHETVAATADRIRSRVADFYPTPSPLLIKRGNVFAREEADRPYDELVLVGHSLGGLVLRRALVDAADEWRQELYPPDKRPVLMDATLRLFSPANGGFQPRGKIGAARATPYWWIAELFLTNGAYVDLKKKSPTIRSTRSRTESYRTDKGRTMCLAASILWANPETVVATERYRTDTRSNTLDGTTHETICKPKKGFTAPYLFVEKGFLNE